MQTLLTGHSLVGAKVMTKTSKKVDPTLERIFREIDELAKIKAISNKLRVRARKVAEKESGDWTCMTHSEMVDLAISLARVSKHD